MIRFVPLVATLALTLVVSIGCAAGPTAATPTTKPDQTEEASTFEPATTPEVAATTPARPTDSAASLDTGLDWPTTVDVTLSTGIYVDEFADGNFTSAATARECGTSYLWPRGFLFGFPHDLDPHDVEDVTFSAHELQPGDSTSSFAISVNIAPAANGPHPLTSLDTSDPQSGATGNARLSVVDGSRTLVVDAAGEGGVSVHLTAICNPI